jgi:predicted RNA-binding Zn-ribbon protein involved in translation (DUF1610 family)
METNPYESPSEAGKAEIRPAKSMACPECGQPMESGYVLSRSGMYWRRWSQRSWLLFPWTRCIPGTDAALPKKLSAFRCPFCELVIFRFGAHRDHYAP